MRGVIGYDLVMEDGMFFVEGTFRILDDGDWSVFIICQDTIEQANIKAGRWETGVSGLCIRVPDSIRLNKQVVEQLLSEGLGVDEWHEVKGADSMQLR